MAWLARFGAVVILAAQIAAPPGSTPDAGKVRKAFEADEDEKFAGHPDGDAPALPKLVNWDWKKGIIAENARRKRVSLAGWWRFSASKEKDEPTDRALMSWIELPGPALRAQWKLADKRFRPIPAGTFGGRPLTDYEWHWIERDLRADWDWVDYRIYLVVKGPWTEGELFVAFLPVAGEERDGGMRYDITEALVYEGECPVAFRLKAPPEKQADAPGAAPYFGLEFLPAGPRVDALAIRRDSDAGELELTLDLKRPPYWYGLAVPLNELPFTANIELRDAVAGTLLREAECKLGTMPRNERTVQVRIPWSAENSPSPEKSRLQLRLSSTLVARHDVLLPLDFETAKLEAVEAK